MSTSWPDPARPGVPLNPERDGWHWIATSPYCTCARWVVHNAGQWSMGALCFPAGVFASTGYLGPCPTPEELAAMLREEWARGMNDAARIAHSDAIRAAAAKLPEPPHAK